MRLSGKSRGNSEGDGSEMFPASLLAFLLEFF